MGILECLFDSVFSVPSGFKRTSEIAYGQFECRKRFAFQFYLDLSELPRLRMANSVVVNAFFLSAF